MSTTAPADRWACPIRSIRIPITKVFLRAAQEAGLPFNPDFNGDKQEGCGLYQVTQRNARRCSAAVGLSEAGPAPSES